MSTRLPQLLRRLARVARLTLVLLLVGGCATHGGLEESQRAVGASLEVANRTGLDLSVSVRGRVEGTVGSGERVRFRHLPGGAAELVATPLERRRGVAWAETAHLEAGAVAVWEIVDEAASVPRPPPLASVAVTNPIGRPVTIGIGGRRVGRILAGETRVFRDLAAGVWAITAATDDGTLSTSAELELREGDANAWTAAMAMARLEVVNDTAEPVELRIDGVRRAELEPGERWVSEAEAPGVRAAVAIGQRTRRPWEATLELAVASPTEWRLASGGASLRVRNATGEALALNLAGREVPTIEPGEEALVEDLEPGALRVTALGAKSRMIYAFEARLGRGQRAEWTPRPVRPTVRVVNDSGVELLIYVESAAIEPRPGAPAKQMRRRGSLAPGRAMLLDDLLPDPFVIEAVEPHGARRLVREIDPRSSPATTWVLERAAGAITIINERPEDLDVFVDARSLGVVEARITRTFTGVLVGPRLVEAQGRRSGATLRSRVEVAEEAPAVARFEDPTATLEIANGLGVALRTTGALADQRASIPAGATISFLVPARPQTLGLVDPDGVPLSWKTSPGPGEVVRWRVAPATSSLVVQNDLDEELAVAVDDAAVGTVAPGATATFTDVATGRRRFATVGMKSGRVRTLAEVATAARPVSWRLETRPGRVIVDNGSAERVEIAIDGRQYRAIEAGASLAYANIPPGPRRVDVVGARSRTRQVFEATVDEGADALIHVAAPMGTLLVDNLSGQDVVVRVDGVKVGRVARDTPLTAVPAPAGQRLVQVERMGDHTVTGMELAIAAGHAVHVLVPPARVRLVVVNQTEAALAVRAGDRALGEVEAGGSVVHEELEPGLVELSARRGDGPATHVERRVLRAGETATWVLQP